MAELQGVYVQKLQGGLGRSNGNLDNHVAMIIGSGIIPAGEVADAINNSGKGVVLTSLYDAEVLGLNASFDANNDLKIHNQIAEFFRLAPEATLYVFNSDVEADLSAFLNQNKEIKGYALNIAYDSETPNLLTEMAKHQSIINSFAEANRLIDFAILGFDGLDVFTTDLFGQSAPNVSIAICCEANDGKVSTGSILGMIAIRQVNENIGSVDIISKPRAKRGNSDYTLTDASAERWLSAFLSDGREIGELTNDELDAIKAKGYIAVAGYEGYAGMFIENSYTCIERASDFAFIENNRTWNKAARIIRTTLLPKVKGIVKKNPTTGYIASTTVSYWKQLLNKALERMVTANEISGFEVDIDPNQVVNSTAPVVIKASIVADGIVHEFDVALGLTNSI